MGYIISMPCLILGLLRVLKKRNLDYMSLTWLEWGFVIFLSAMKLYGMYPFSSKVYFLLAIGIFFYSVFCYLGVGSKKKYHISWGGFGKANSFKYELRYWLLCLFEIILSLFVIYVSLRTFALLFNGVKMGTIHAMYLNRGNEAFFESTILKEIHAKFAVPMLYCNCAIAAFLIVFRRRQYKMLKIICILNLIIWVVVTGGRFILAYFLMDLILAFSLSEISISEKAKKKIKIVIRKIMFLLIIIVVGYTIFRKGFLRSKEKGSVISQVWEEFYKYFSLSIPLFQYWIDRLDFSQTLTYGTMSLYGILSNINWFIVKMRIGTLAFLADSNVLLSNIENMIPIFRNASCNAFVTCFFYFYADAGIIGIIIGSSLFGWISGIVERAAQRYTNNRNILFYLLFSQSIIKMFVRFELGNAAYIIAFIYMLLLTKKQTTAKEL